MHSITLLTLNHIFLHQLVGIIFREISSRARSVVLASGSLSPIMSLCAELDLVSPQRSTPPLSNDKMNDDPSISTEHTYRLQLVPKPLEADHIIDMGKQLLAFSIGVFPDGSSLTVKQSSYTQRGFLTKIGTALVKIITAVPRGGILSKFLLQKSNCLRDHLKITDLFYKYFCRATRC